MFSNSIRNGLAIVLHFVYSSLLVNWKNEGDPIPYFLWSSETFAGPRPLNWVLGGNRSASQLLCSSSNPARVLNTDRSTISIALLAHAGQRLSKIQSNVASIICVWLRSKSSITGSYVISIISDVFANLSLSSCE